MTSGSWQLLVKPKQRSKIEIDNQCINPMELLEQLLPGELALRLKSWESDAVGKQFILRVSSTQAIAHCPLCNYPSGRVHSHYERTLHDLPLVQFSLTILLEVYKFFCGNEGCQRRIFTERLPTVVAPWARQTARCREQLKAVALALGGSAAARLSHQLLGYRYSRNTFLNLLSGLPLPPIKTPRVLGVDDFALRKGHHYGTILVDLETHRPVALLPDRTAETLAAWLKEHPGIEILSRDRSKSYKRGMSEGAPAAIQVADRFHLLQNLEETLEKAFQGKAPAIKVVEASQLQSAGIPLPELPKPKNSHGQRREAKRAQRLENYHQVHALRKEGYTIKDIAHHLGMGKRTVYTYLSHSSFPEWQPSSRQYGSSLDPYKPYLIEQWQQGKRHAKRLFEEIQTHWMLVFVAYSILHLACLPPPTKAPGKRPTQLTQSIGQVCRQQSQALMEKLILFAHDCLEQGESAATVFAKLFDKQNRGVPA